jgi:5'-3' exonuclease
VYEQFKIYPENFAVARAIVGDASDNLKGLKGIGFKKLIKHLPFMTEDKKVELDGVFEFCQQDEKKYQKYLEGKQTIINNYKIMQLTDPIIGFPSIKKIRDSLEEKLSFSATRIRIKMIQDGMTSFDDGFFQPFRILNAKGKQYGDTEISE